MITLEKAILMRRFGWQTTIVNGIVLSAIVLGWTTAAVAQRRPIADDTLGAESSTVIPLDPQEASDRIEGGAQRGDNLFHSFREFHVEQGRSVYFADPGVENIVGRVTGGVESRILGVLGVLGDANLFLLNPSGIIFGDNARLDVRGSFMATTADTMQFGEQGFFSATDPTAPPLLTVQPTAFLFNQLNPAPIVNRSIAPLSANLSSFSNTGLRVPAGESLTLLGGNIRMIGGGLTAPGGRVEIGGLSEPGTVRFNADGSLSFPAEVARSDVFLRGAFIDVIGNGGGSITVNARELKILIGFLSAGISSNSGLVGTQAGDITLNASTIRGRVFTTIINLVDEGGVGNGGDIRITTDSLSLTDFAQIGTSTAGQGDAGDVIIHARDRVALRFSGIFSSVEPSSANTPVVGAGGNIEITTNSLLLTDAGQVAAITFAQGNAGNVIIHARDRVSLDGTIPSLDAPSAIVSIVGDFEENEAAVGDGGNVEITTRSLSLTNGAQLLTTVFGQGDAGDVILNVRDRITLDGSSILSNVSPGATGNGGDIRINTGSFSLNGAQLITSTLGQGDAGNVTIRARDRVSLEGTRQQRSLLLQSGIFTSTEVGAEGRGGNVRIAANSVRLADGGSIFSSTQNRFPGGTITVNANTFEAIEGAQVNTSSNNQGRVGNIILNVSDRITLSGVTNNRPISLQGNASGLYASTAPGASAPGGNIQITTDQLQVFDRARIAVDSQGSGIGGGVNITASRVQLDDRARITAETGADDGGNITLRNVELLQLSNNSLITTTAGTERAGGDGGDINIDADFIVAFPNKNSDILANAFTGSGGNVDITSQGLFGIAAQPQESPLTNDITASSERGVQGTVDITLPDVDPRRGLVELPVEVVDASTQITQTCSSAEALIGEFVVTGRGGIPSSPLDPLVGDDSFAEWSTLDEQESAPAPLSREDDGAQAGAIVEAQGWVMAEDGTVRLIATASASRVRSPEVCQRPVVSVIWPN
ncbi:S-layer family protein [Leptolyngbya sp. FACHB-671]|uniref:beta strand repeat-containing protein n=1 Tax=Leptolyngbya sp. FACHB-671 TaxID=2692812 RepID=UPI001A7EB9BE|nr:S-layer family protein [Leptolyngbya sp. FACHB-671]